MNTLNMDDFENVSLSTILVFVISFPGVDEKTISNRK
jgi:hypothetical protein